MGAGGIGVFMALSFRAEILFACCWGGGSLDGAGATGEAGMQPALPRLRGAAS